MRLITNLLITTIFCVTGIGVLIRRDGPKNRSRGFRWKTPELMQNGQASVFHMSGNGNMPHRGQTVVFIRGVMIWTVPVFHHSKEDVISGRPPMWMLSREAQVPSAFWIWWAIYGNGPMNSGMIIRV